MLRNMKETDFVSRMGTAWDVMAKETLMFPGVDAAAVAVGLVTGPRQHESPLIRVLKEFLYSRNHGDVVKHDDANEYLECKLDRDEFCHAFSNHRSMNGDFRDASWARDNLSRWERNSVGGKYCAVVYFDGCTKHDHVMFLRDFLSQVVTRDEEEKFYDIRKLVTQKTGGDPAPDSFLDHAQAKDGSQYLATDKLWKFTPQSDNSSGQRNVFGVIEPHCRDWPQDFDTGVHGDSVRMLQISSEFQAGDTSKYERLKLLNSSRLVVDRSDALIVSTLAFSMISSSGNNDFSIGMAKVIHHMNATDPRKGKFRVTVPIFNTEFPLISARDLPVPPPKPA